jgi:hypothetical protein
MSSPSTTSPRTSTPSQNVCLEKVGVRLGRHAPQLIATLKRKDLS